MTTISILLQQAQTLLKKTSSSSEIDAELLLMHVLNVSRAYLHTWPAHEVTTSQKAAYLELINRRAAGEPIAYLIGHQGFWNLNLKVDHHVLIPRPETELLVELVLKQFNAKESYRIADLGTGSGAIALAIAHERPHWEIWGIDKSNEALKIAEENANKLGIKNIKWLKSDWCFALPAHYFHALVSNPPYIAKEDPHLLQGDLRFEPQSALVSGANGLQDLQTIIQQSTRCLIEDGVLLLEHGYDQGLIIRKFLLEANYTHIETFKDLAHHERVTSGQRNSL